MAEAFVEKSRPTQHYETLKNLGDCYAAMGRCGQALESYQEAGLLEPTYPGHKVGIGAVALLQGRWADALEAFLAARELDGRSPEVWWGLAMVHQAQNLHADAKKLFANTLTLDANNLAALLGLYYSCREANDFTGLQGPLTAYLDKHPGDAEALLCQADLHRRANQPQDAGNTLLTVLALDPSNAAAKNMLSLL